MAHRSRPYVHVSIPPGAAPPSNPSPSVHELPVSPINLWADRRHPIYTPYPPGTPTSVGTTQYGGRMSLDVPGRPPSRAASAYEVETTRIAFPEPQLYRSSSQRSTQRPHAAHRSTRSESIALSPDSLLTPTPSRFSYSEQSSYGGGSRPHSMHSYSDESRPPSIQNTPEVRAPSRVCLSA